MRHITLIKTPVPRVCECADCGKRFNFGDEGDNEEFCLRCEREGLWDNGLEEDGDHGDD